MFGKVELFYPYFSWIFGGRSSFFTYVSHTKATTDLDIDHFFGCFLFKIGAMHDGDNCLGLFCHGSLNVPIEHHPTIIGIWSTKWLLFQVMSNIPKMGQLPSPEFPHLLVTELFKTAGIYGCSSH